MMAHKSSIIPLPTIYQQKPFYSENCELVSRVVAEFDFEFVLVYLIIHSFII